MTEAAMDDDPLVRLGRWLRAAGYAFVTVTPATHARLNARASARQARSIADVFGWSRHFSRDLLPAAVVEMLAAAGALRTHGDLWGSDVRFSSLGTDLYVHSAFPTLDADSVFFGPDTYRFAALIERTLGARPAANTGTIVDVGCGSGAGGIVACRAASSANGSLILADINPQALRHARINATLAGLPGARVQLGDLYAGIEGSLDVIVANPPYLVDPEARLYRHGGGPLGTGLSERIVREGVPRLGPEGVLILYTGVPMIAGHDPLRAALAPTLLASGATWTYVELDPDVFGEELDAPAYAGVDRIAVVALVVTAPAADADRARLRNVGA